MAKDVKIRIRAMESYRRVISGAIRALGRLRSAARSVTRVSGMAFRRMAVVGGIAIGGLGLAIKKAFDFELYRNQFAILLGGMDKAKERFAALKALSSETPFQLEELIKASKLLEAFGFKGEQNIKTLKEVGDAAASMDPSKLEEIAFWMGRLSVGAQAGQTGEATNRLLELALITGKAKSEIDGMAKAGANQAAIMARARDEIMRFKGGMDKLKTTGHGLFSTLKDNWTLALATFGDAFKVQAKDAIAGLIDKLKELREDGTIERWAESAAKALENVKQLIDAVMAGGEDRRIAIKGLKEMGAGFSHSALDYLRDKMPDLGRSFAEAMVDHGPAIGDAIIKGMGVAVVGAPKALVKGAADEALGDTRAGKWFKSEMETFRANWEALSEGRVNPEYLRDKGPLEVKIVNPEALTAQ